MLPINKQEKTDAVIQVENLHKNFMVGAQDVSVLKGFSFSINKGDFVVIFGPSGCGKSTLLHILLGLEIPTQGSVYFLNQDLYKNTSEDLRSDIRKQHLGMVYQMSNWVKSLTVIENVSFPLLLEGVDKPKALNSALEMLKKVEMEEWARFIPTELSSGQQQRIALARAMINNPEIIIADEPTGNLDYESGEYVMGIFKAMNESMGKTIVMVTHDLEYLPYAKTAIRMMDGNVVEILDKDEIAKLYGELRFKRIDIKNEENIVSTITNKKLVNEDKSKVGNTFLNGTLNTKTKGSSSNRFKKGKTTL